MLKIHVNLKAEMQRLQENHKKTVTKIKSTDIYKAVSKFYRILRLNNTRKEIHKDTQTLFFCLKIHIFCTVSYNFQ